MHLSLFDYELPSSFVAQQPAEPRVDGSLQGKSSPGKEGE